MELTKSTNLPATCRLLKSVETIDYNGDGRWSCESILERYAQFAAEARIAPRDISPTEQTGEGRRWVYPVMQKVIEGIEADDPACVRLGIEFIHEDAKFPFGRILKSNAARALRRTTLSAEQRERIRRRVLAMLKAGNVPHEFREYAKLLKKIGVKESDLADVPGKSERVARFKAYLLAAAQSSH